MLAEQALSKLQAALKDGRIRAVDWVFAKFLLQLDPQLDGWLLLAAALTSRQLGHGHICLPMTLLLEPAVDDTAFNWIPVLSPEQWKQAMQSSVLVGTGPGNSPLVIANQRLYLRRYWQYEVDVAEGIADRLDRVYPLPEGLPEQLTQLFPSSDDTQIDWQKVACALALRKPFCVITGGPGTGKTTTVLKLLALLQQQAAAQGVSVQMLLAAPTGKAAARLSESISKALPGLPEALRQTIPQQVLTLHRLLGARPDTRQFRHHRQNPLHADVVIVDEASMIDLEMMAALLLALKPEARLILLGDKDQLASVEAGSVLGDLCLNAGKLGYDSATVDWLKLTCGCAVEIIDGVSSLDGQIAMLRVSHRFSADSGIGQLAHAVNDGDGEKAIRLLQTADFSDIRRIAGFDEFDRLILNGWNDAQGAGYRDYLQVIQQLRPEDCDAERIETWAQAVLSAFERFQVLCALREGDYGVQSLNRRIAALLHQTGLISQTNAWYEGRPVLVKRNDYGLGLMNGDIGIALRIPDANSDTGRLRVVFRQSQAAIKQVLPSRLTDVEDVYAMTVHKSQGSEFDHVTMVLPDQAGALLTRELLYTGITRAKNRFSLLCSADAVLRKAAEARVARAGGLSDRYLGYDER